MIQAGYELLGLITFLTAGPKEARAWTVPRGTSAPEAAGSIHSDFKRGFICAEVVAYGDYLALSAARRARAKPASCARRAATTSSRTATSSTSASTSR